MGGYMFQHLKTRIRSKFADTVFGNASSGIKYLYAKNSRIFYVQMVIAFIASILITGYGALLLMNLGGSGYLMNLRNIIAAWFNKGILISLIIFIMLEMLFFRAVLLFRTNFRKDEDRNYDVSNEGTYGTNSTMSEEEMKQTFYLGPIEDVKAPIFGKNPYNISEVVGQRHPLMKLNRNVLMMSGPSGGKSATYIIPLILQILRLGHSAIINDPKSELFKITSELAKLLGYEVRILNLNPMFLENSDPCNFMMYVGDDVDKAQVMSKAIIANTTGGEAMLDFWTEGASNLLQAIILRISVGNDFRPEEKNLPMIFKYITSHPLEDMEADFDTLPDSHPATAPFRIFAAGEEKVKKQVIQGLGIKLKLFNSRKLQTILSATEGNIDFLNPGRKRCLYFIGSNDQDSSMKPIVSLFFTLFYQELVRYADMRMDQELPVTVHMVLDEFPSIYIPDFQEKLSTVRSRNIVTHLAIQDINQLETKYPGMAFRTIINDIDYFLLLKTNDTETMKWWSEMSGEQTINVKNRRYERNKMDVLGIHAQESVTEGQGTRQVFTEGEVRSLKDDEVLLQVSQRDTIKLKTFYWATDHPYGRFIKENQDKMYVLPAQHYPFWRLIRDGIVDKDFDYDHEPSFVLEIPPDEKLDIDKDYDPDSMLRISKKSKSGGLERQIMKKNGVIVSGVRTRLRDRANQAKLAFIGRMEDKLPVNGGTDAAGKPEDAKDTAVNNHAAPLQPMIRFVTPNVVEPEKNTGKGNLVKAGVPSDSTGIPPNASVRMTGSAQTLSTPETVFRKPEMQTHSVERPGKSAKSTPVADVAERADRQAQTVSSSTADKEGRHRMGGTVQEVMGEMLMEQRDKEEQEAIPEASAAGAFSFFDNMQSLDEIFKG